MAKKKRTVSVTVRVNTETDARLIAQEDATGWSRTRIILHSVNLAYAVAERFDAEAEKLLRDRTLAIRLHGAQLAHDHAVRLITAEKKLAAPKPKTRKEKPHGAA